MKRWTINLLVVVSFAASSLVFGAESTFIRR